MRGDNDRYLFSGASVHGVVQNVLVQAMEDLKTLNENALLSTPTRDLVQAVQQKFDIAIPELTESNTWIDEREVTTRHRASRDDSFFTGAQPSYSSKSHVVDFHVPFTGDAAAFHVQPSQRSLPGPAAVVVGEELVITLSTDRLSSEQVRQAFDRVVNEIKQHLITLKRDMTHVTSQIERPATDYIEGRKAQLLRSKDIVSSLGFPMRRRPDAPTTFKAPEVRRKIAPGRPVVVAPFKPEPALDEQDYQHILNVMDNMTKVMERSPHTFKQMGEEDIRQHFLVQLNGQYEGQASGETFNFEGKTDILIRSEGRNVFIAECKFWQGEKVFQATIDQLLSYLTWRDSKAALVIFNRNKDLSSVLATIKASLPKHADFKSGPKVEGETRFRCVFGSPGDPSREIVVTVLVYDIPTD